MASTYSHLSNLFNQTQKPSIMAVYPQGFVSLLATQTGESCYPGFVDLSGSQSINMDSSEIPSFSTQSPEVASTSRERKSWSVKEDVILISAWLNTSKDAVVGNEQRAGTFWKRIQAYYNSSVVAAAFPPRELCQIRQRWCRINDLVSKFCGCYDAALRDQASGENDNDVMKTALDFFSNDYASKFTLEHAWRELRHDQKWTSLSQGKEGGKEKRKGKGSAVEGEEEDPGARPQGVKAAKAAKRKKKGVQEEPSSDMKGVLELKAVLNNQRLLEKLLEKSELSELELALKHKLMTQML